MSDKPISPLVKRVVERVNDDLIHLGGLTDQHVKMITFYVTEKLGFKKFRYEIKYLEKPKRFIIHIFSHDGTMELYCKPKPADILDKMAEYLKLPEWKISFAERNVKDEQ